MSSGAERRLAMLMDDEELPDLPPPPPLTEEEKKAAVIGYLESEEGQAALNAAIRDEVRKQTTVRGQDAVRIPAAALRDADPRMDLADRWDRTPNIGESAAEQAARRLRSRAPRTSEVLPSARQDRERARQDHYNTMSRLSEGRRVCLTEAAGT